MDPRAQSLNPKPRGAIFMLFGVWVSWYQNYEGRQGDLAATKCLALIEPNSGTFGRQSQVQHDIDRVFPPHSACPYFFFGS